MGKIIDGKARAEKIKAELTNEISELKQKGITPGLATILIGDDPASVVYVNMKQKTCNQLGIYSEKIQFPSDVEDIVVEEKINQLNERSDIHGILVQLPIPERLRYVLNLIHPLKDVDGFHPENIGNLASGNEKETFIPCTPLGILTLIEDITTLKGKDVTIINHSSVVGRPLANLLLNRDATVTICHVATKNIAQFTKNAEILITAVGVPRLIKAEMIKKDAIVIDAGFSRVDGKIVGDVDFENALEIASFITPPTGGVGPMTITMLMKNTVKAARITLETE
ncbi:MAG: bifunctional 5,10-methylenetetrahydrofolate dehydrogenase/5,10-methenyltetrahydrofolate cyclohydrolase [Candidatus Helarchaeales archaeon]